MDKATWMTYAFSAIWVGIGLFIAMLALRQGNLERRLRQIESLKK